MGYRVANVDFKLPPSSVRKADNHIPPSRRGGALQLLLRLGTRSAESLQDGVFDRSYLKATLDGRKWPHVERWLSDLIEASVVRSVGEELWQIEDFDACNITRDRYESWCRRVGRDFRKLSRTFPSRLLPISVVSGPDVQNSLSRVKDVKERDIRKRPQLAPGLVGVGCHGLPPELPEDLQRSEFPASSQDMGRPHAASKASEPFSDPDPVLDAPAPSTIPEAHLAPCPLALGAPQAAPKELISAPTLSFVPYLKSAQSPESASSAEEILGAEDSEVPNPSQQDGKQTEAPRGGLVALSAAPFLAQVTALAAKRALEGPEPSLSYPRSLSGPSGASEARNPASSPPPPSASSAPPRHRWPPSSPRRTLASLPASQRAPWRPAVNLHDVEELLRKWDLAPLPGSMDAPDRYFRLLKEHGVSGSEWHYGVFVTQRTIDREKSRGKKLTRPLAHLWAVVKRQRAQGMAAQGRVDLNEHRLESFMTTFKNDRNQ